MSKSSPSSPDPEATAASQWKYNEKALNKAADINAVNQYGPSGSTTYTKDANGVPTAQTVTLSPGEQQYYDTQTALRNSLASGIADQGSFTAPDSSRPDAVEKALYERKVAMVQPQLDQAQNDLNTQLMERGIPIGSEVYTNEQNRLAQDRSNTLASIAQDATLASGQESSRQLQDALASYNADYNALASINGGSSITTPTYQSSPSYSISSPDISGYTYQDYANRVNAYNNQNSSFLNGLFGLGSAALSLSDIRLKTDLRRVGRTDDGVPVYTFRYVFGGPVHMGVMAQELEDVNPAAVHDIGGIKYVDYARVN